MIGGVIESADGQYNSLFYLGGILNAEPVHLTLDLVS